MPAASTLSRSPIIAFAVIALIVATAIGAALFGLPVRTWFEQNDEVRSLDRELDELQAVNAELQSEVDRLQTSPGIREAARDELGMTHFVYKPHWPGLPHREAMAQLEEFGTTVLPELRS